MLCKHLVFHGMAPAVSQTLYGALPQLSGVESCWHGCAFSYCRHGWVLTLLCHTYAPPLLQTHSIDVCICNHVLCRNPVFEERLLRYFGDGTTDAHLKMADTPEDETQLIDYTMDNGQASPFPLVQCRNVFVLPGGWLTGGGLFLS